MEKYIEILIENIQLQRLIFAIVGVIIILTLKNLLRARIGKSIKDHNNSYRSKKAISAVGYFFILLFVSIIYRENLGSLTVFFGIAGAGIAFALQEVIVSIAGWKATYTMEEL